MPLQTAHPAAGGRGAAPAGDGGEAEGGDGGETSVDERSSQSAESKEGGRAKANCGRKNGTALQVNIPNPQHKAVGIFWMENNVTL